MRQYSAMEPYQDMDNEPVYNMKAVVEATGISAATLRAWERRYGAFSPGRTESGYRLYSARDIAVLRWLKGRVDEGMSISQAISLLGHQRPSATRPHQTTAAASMPMAPRGAGALAGRPHALRRGPGRAGARRGVCRLRARKRHGIHPGPGHDADRGHVARGPRQHRRRALRQQLPAAQTGRDHQRRAPGARRAAGRSRLRSRGLARVGAAGDPLDAAAA